MNLREFQQSVLAENGVQNDVDNVLVVVEGKQYTVDINEVLHYEEEEPFEASYNGSVVKTKIRCFYNELIR